MKLSKTFKLRLLSFCFWAKSFICVFIWLFSRQCLRCLAQNELSLAFFVDFFNDSADFAAFGFEVES